MEKKILYKHICKEDTYMFNYTQLPDELFTIEAFSGLSLHAKVLYSFMLRRISISKNNNWIDDTGDVYIYYRADEIMEKFNCSNKTASKIMAELEEIGLIEKKRQGQGKPDIIYVNKFSEAIEQDKEPELPIENPELYYTGEGAENPEVKNVHFQKCKNYTSKDVKNTSQEVKILQPNYKDNNYNNELSSSSRESLRLMEEDEEEYKRRINYQEAERLYSAHIATTAFAELMKRDMEYRQKITPEMFQRVCKTIASSKEPVLYPAGLINWCYDHIDFSPPLKTNLQWNQFMERDYDIKEIEKMLLGNK